jgi:hypothetical protein
MAVAIFPGCATKPKPAPRQARPRQETPLPEAPSPEAPLPETPPSAAPLPAVPRPQPAADAASPSALLYPFSREMIDLAAKSEVSIKNFQYYISETVLLENEKNTQRISHNNRGEVLLQESSTHEQIVINRETGGKLTNITTDDNGKSWILEVRFGNNNNDFLLFKESTDGTRFELAYLENEDVKKVSMGGVEYVLRFTERPCLLVKLVRVLNSRPDRTILPGALLDYPVSARVF